MEQTIFFFSENILEILNRGMLSGTIANLHDLMLKLIVLADRYHMRQYGMMISNDEYWAMQYGPVPSCAKNIAEMSSRNTPEILDYASRFLTVPAANLVKSIAPVDFDQLGRTEWEALDFAFNIFMTENDIVDVTHRLPEWKHHENRLQNGATRIKMNPLDFFTPIQGKDYGGNASVQRLNLAKEFFIEDSRINRALK